ncbi:MAG: hypothetical protein ACXWLM_05605 [Myxococcales bacterium]
MYARAAFFAVAIGAALSAHAQLTTEVVAGPRAPVSEIGIGFGIGGGATNFIASEMTDVTDPGPGWDVRAVIGTRLPVAGEVAYVGTRRNLHLASVSGSSAGETPHIFSHGFEAAARLQYPYVAGKWLVEPFAFGGVGYSHLGIDGVVAANSTIRTTSDDVLVVPFGAGITAGWNSVLFEARFTYRAAFNQDLLEKPDGSFASLNNWAAGATLGYEF